ncbi:lytic transglycosylase domain-containing protein [Arthrobacter sp. ATA002]|uniref:aggregation-promoting factor C-terminal-like domain-containing protein n=1 Tax=Arthrobacter sp. ATA002 TaxID=2991715 RepID=UPI0022A7BFB4|nr:lytic transglycosylase domain-containing protein [Arthrobacter sp. ATA002]WAP51013.1 lytic transglycosylase domain-containing protein [Arthrobacter sp. ATA002]
MLTMLLQGKKFSFVSMGSVVLTGVLAAAVLTAVPASAADFPSWDEVEQAKQSVEATEKQAAEIEALLGEVSADAGRLGNAAVRATADHQRAASEAEAASRTLDVLSVQRAEAAAAAGELTEQMGALAAQTYKTGGVDSSLLMLLDADAAVDAMDRITTLQGISGRTDKLRADASAAANVLRSLEEREAAAAETRDEAAAESLQLARGAQAAAAAADAAVRGHGEQSAVLLGQLAVLRDSSAELEEERLRGLQAEEDYQRQQAAREAEEAAREADRQKDQDSEDRGGLTPPPLPGGPAPVINPTPAPKLPAPPPVTPVPPAPPAPKLPPGPAPAPVDDPAGAQAYAAGRLAAFGWGPDQQRCLVNLWQRESGWRTSANNPFSGAYGIPQSLPGDKMATAGADWRTNYRTQIEWGLGYIAARYGSPCAAWQHSEDKNWY